MRDKGSTCRVLVAKSEGKKPLERCTYRWALIVVKEV
jgi:hypothetical protein